MNPGSPAREHVNSRRGREERWKKELENLKNKFLTNEYVDDFFSWLVKKRGVSVKTARQYVGYIQKHLLDNSWSIRSHRLFLHYLHETYGLEVNRFLEKLKVPRSGVDLRVPSIDEIYSTLKVLRDYPRAKTFFIFLLVTGLRAVEVHYLLNNSPGYNDYDNVRVYKLGMERGSKKVFYAFTPIWLGKEKASMNYYKKIRQKHGLLPAKYVRKFFATKCFELGISAEVIDFIQGRTPRSILVQHYLNLLPTAVREYRKYSNWLKQFLGESVG
ncbi:MAG: hypothetical protein J7K23_04235 [Thermoproteales archaeon]|nr:hypothetical protein [Thermoproteales archaeon]